MSKIKYKKGEYIKEIWSGIEMYIFKVIKDIPLELWEDKSSRIDRNYVKGIDTYHNDIENKYSVVSRNLKQYKVPYMNTALYKILNGDNYE